MSEKDFFEEQTEQSEIKTEIVHEYFWIWSHIIANHLKKKGNYKIGYVDLFAGPGRYKDGSKSTPLVMLETAIQHPEFSQTLATYFNDKKLDNCNNLENEIKNLTDVDILNYQAVVTNFRVDDSLIGWIEKNLDFPCLYFLDPCGYKGLSLKLVQFILKGFGCDCIFFFNYNRINQHLENPVMDNNMNSFFGRQRAEKLRMELIGKSKEERQDLIINNLKDALIEHGGTYSIDYCFTKNDGNRTSHFLIFTSKHPAGFKKMIEVMGRKSSGRTQGVPTFSFNPKDKDKEKIQTLFDLHDSPIDKLSDSLLDKFAGQNLTMKEVYYAHGLRDNEIKYLLENYKDALRKLEEQKKIIAKPPVNERQKREGKVTFGPNVVISFPKK